ncbi:MAG: C10 family peptidase [Prevotella sp.]|nr:C10 family peptidase [Prevotella sp.]
MKKAYLALLLAVTSMGTAFGSPVSQAQALKKATLFFSERGHASPTLQLVQRGQKSAARPGSANEACYYIFNQGADEGFVIVAGDDCASEVLGYADRGHFDATNVPENMQALLDCYAEEITQARSLPATTAKAPEAKNEAWQVVAPMLTTSWGQDEPFNLECFTTNGAQAVTGCVATAFAQVMYYHKWPRTSTMEIPAYSSYDALPSITFDWALMKNSYDGSGDLTDASNKAVADLMLYCGHAVYMSYGTGASAGSTSYIPSALSNYFGYGNKATEVQRSNYSTEEWNRLIYDELVAGRPVIYSAKSANGGHAFVCDGFDGYGLYHINWGWCGLSDGYFRLQALNPNSQGTGGGGTSGYSNNQYVIVGFSPQVTSQGGETKAESGITTVDIQLVDNSWNEIAEGTYSYNNNYGLSSARVYYYYSHTGLGTAYDVGIGLFDSQGQLVDTYVIRSGYQGSSNSWNANGFSLYGFGKNLADGTYYIRGIDRLIGTDEWYPSIKSDILYLKVVKSGSKFTVTAVKDNRQSQLMVKSVTQNFERGTSPKCLRIVLANTGEKVFQDPLYLYVDGNLVTYETAYLSPGGEDYVDFYFYHAAGTCKVELATSTSPLVICYTNEAFTLSDDANTGVLPVLTTVSSELKNVDCSTMYGSLIDGVITLQNSTSQNYNSPLTLRLLKPAYDGWWYVYDNSLPANIPAGQTVTLHYSLPISVGETFQISVCDANKTYASYGSKTVKAGFITWTAGGDRTATALTKTFTVPADAAAASFEEAGTLSGYTIKANSNPNTLYYIPHGATVPSSLNNKNVVKSYEAGTITLVEGQGFYVPKNFSATKVSYTRTPTLTGNGLLGWQTITVPFAVQTVTSAGTAVSRLKSGSTATSGYWLKEFDSDNGSTVTFSDVEGWIANAPYIIATTADCKGKKLVLSASNAMVMQTSVSSVVSKNYQYNGVTGGKTVSNAYVMNSAGSAFALTPQATVKSGEAYFTTSLSSANAPSLLPIGGLPGDVNGDGSVTISDVSLTVEYILGNEAANFIEANADMNGDGSITIADVTAIVEIILSN